MLSHLILEKFLTTKANTCQMKANNELDFKNKSHNTVVPEFVINSMLWLLLNDLPGIITEVKTLSNAWKVKFKYYLHDEINININNNINIKFVDWY